MNNTALKKWGALLGLLLLTLILVWQAPEPEPVDLVKVRQASERDSVTRLSLQPQPSAASLTLRPRQHGGETVDLFAAPIKPPVASVPVIRQPVISPPQPSVTLPFRYVGMLQSGRETSLFVMAGPSLYLVQEGDTVNQDFRLQQIDRAKQELVWLYLPLNETRKMSMEQ